MDVQNYNKVRRRPDMSVKKELFGKTADGRDITAFTIENGNIGIRVLDFGAVLVNLCTPDKNGKMEDIVLGFDRPEQYLSNKDYFGATIGPVANRIGKAKFALDGVEYTLPVNDGENNLHTDAAKGLHKQLWQAQTGENCVTFTISVPDGEYGLPGNKDFSVTYTVTEENGVKIHYHAVSDKKTILNPTNHTYFNLDGHTAGSIENTELTLNCSAYTPTDEHSIPTGEIRSVEGTAFDFRTAKTIGQDINEQDPQLIWAHGYDHNYCVDGYNGDGEVRLIASAVSRTSGRKMEVYTDLPGVQFYCGNYVDDKDGKQGHDYGFRSAFCLETQYYPDSVNHDNFPGSVFDAGEVYDSTTEYRFSLC